MQRTVKKICCLLAYLHDLNDEVIFINLGMTEAHPFPPTVLKYFLLIPAMNSVVF